MEWIDIKVEKPTKEGKYIVCGLSQMNNKKRLDTKWNGKAFHCSLKVTHWLKENNED